MDRTISPIKRVTDSRAIPPPPASWATRPTSNMVSHVTVLATTTAARAVVGKPNRVWAAERVITPVMVPGLAANRIKGIRDVPATEVALVDACEDDARP